MYLFSLRVTVCNKIIVIVINQTSADWPLYCDVTRHGFVVMHVVFRFLLRIFVYAAKQAFVLNTTGLLKSQTSNVAS